MKRLVGLAAIILFCGNVFSQGIYSPIMPTVYGRHDLRVKADSASHIAEKADTTKNTGDTSAQIFLRKLDGKVWGYSRVRGFFKIEGLAITDTTGKWISAIYRSHDSVFTCKNGTCTFAYKDSVGGSSITGADTRVIFMDGANNPSTDADITYNKTTNRLTVGSLQLPTATIYTTANGGFYAGNGAGNPLAVGNNRIAIGTGAGAALDSSNNSTLMGTGAGAVHITGESLTAYGKSSMNTDISGYGNAAFGANGHNISGNYLAWFGSECGQSNTTGSQNTGMGFQSMASNTVGSLNTAIGYYSLNTDTSGFNNTSIGVYTLNDLKNGSYNTAIGSGAGAGAGNTNSKFFNRSNGSYSGNYLEFGDYSSGSLAINVASTTGSPFGHTVTFQVGESGGTGTVKLPALGASTIDTTYKILVKNSSGNVTWFNSYAQLVTALGIGGSAPNLNTVTTTGNTSTVDIVLQGARFGIGLGAVSTNLVAGNNALSSNTSGGYNTAVGTNALAANTTANYNTALGAASLQSNTGTANTATGLFALTANTTGSNNAATGYQSLMSNLTGDYNSAFGYNAGNSSTGGLNTYVGAASNGSGSNNTVIGAQVTIGSVSNHIAIGNGNGTIKLHYYGDDSVQEQNIKHRINPRDVLGVIDSITGLKSHIPMSSIVAGSVPLSSVTAAVANNDINHGDNQQTWRFNSLAQNHHGLSLTTSAWTGNGIGSFGGGLLNLNSTSTAFTTSGVSNLFTISAGAVNSNSSVTTVGTYTAISSIGTTSTNIGSYYDISGATTNYAIYVTTGNINIQPLTASLPLKLDASKNITSAAINISGSEITGTLPVANGGTGITSLGTGIATWWGTPSSANLAAAITDETGTGVSVFGTTPTFTTSIIDPLVIGSISSGGTLTIQSTSHATKGKILFGTSAYDEVNNRLGLGLTNPATTFDIGSGTALLGAIQTTGVGVNGNFYSGSGVSFVGSGAAAHQIHSSSSLRGRIFTNGTTATAIANGEPYVSVVIGASSVTEGSSNTHTDIGSLAIKAPTITGAGAAVTNAWTVYIESAPTCTATNLYSLWIDDGTARLDGGILGTTTNDAATAGNIGQEINAIQSTYTNFTTTAIYQNITSITLTAGDWDLSAQGTFSSNGATITGASDAIFLIGTATASATGSVEGQSISYVPQAALLGTSHESFSMSPYRISISSTTTYYLNAQATFTIGNPQFVGGLRARRVR